MSTGWRGHLMVDDYAGYKSMFVGGPTELDCLAHIRRKFFDVHAAGGSPVAEHALQRIAKLYAIEQQGAGLDPPQRKLLREQLALPPLAELHAWLLANQRTVATGSGTAKAIEHALKRWPALQRYASSGSLPIDNNPVENAIRPIAIGKKNWLFAGSERAGRRAAAIQTCSPPPSSTVWTQRVGWLTRSKNCQLAPTARSTRCYRSQTLTSTKWRRKVGPLAAGRLLIPRRISLQLDCVESVNTAKPLNNKNYLSWHAFCIFSGLTIKGSHEQYFSDCFVVND